MQAVDLSNEVAMAIDRKQIIMQVDEFLVNKRTVQSHAWSKKLTNICIDYRESYTKPKACILAVSREAGVDLVAVFNNSITGRKFKVFLEELRAKHPFEDICLILDNLSLHKSREMKGRMDELGFNYCYTPIYSPEFNGGVETAIGLGKLKLKQLRLDAILKEKELSLNGIIKSIYYKLNVQQVAKCVARSLQLLNL